MVVISWEGTRAAGGGDPSVLLGDQVILVLEPLSADAEFSVCITGRVVQIEQLRDAVERP
ncbi:hypothetical protein D1825_16035 [Cellulomonas rhizosphaerae]|uniref:Uncharacterized protein n=1 Tax=Cellulomonas rhizosphaerae TaxID=2293719 RepID=A0A413RHT3_9CELL|nr:hypothetical protein D1825_16035 [Cellulomonas rhizosphaerae]